MTKAKVRLYMGSEKRPAYLTKEVDFYSIPKKKDWISLLKDEIGGNFSFRVTDVMPSERPLPEVVLQQLVKTDSEFDYIDHKGLDNDIHSLVEANWCLIWIKPNTTFKSNDTL